MERRALIAAAALVCSGFLRAPGAEPPPLGLDAFIPVPEANPLTRSKVELGRQLFQDKRLSRDGSVACTTCHEPQRAFSDGRPLAVGVFGRQGRRHSPALINRGYGSAFFWDARSASLEEQVLLPIQDPNEMDLSLADVRTRVGLEPQTVAYALASFVRSIVSGGSRYDLYMNGDRAALNYEEQAGLAIFRGKGNCTSCHLGPNFSDESLHNTGVAWRNGTFLDSGAGEGRFKTPTLRQIASTAPYMHDGSLKTLEGVVDYYDRGGNVNTHLDHDLHPLRLREEEKRALVAFLSTLTGSVQVR